MKRRFQLILVLLVTLGFSYVGIWNQLVAAKEKATIHLVAVGDSLTEGIGDTTGQQGYTKRTAKLIAKENNVKVVTANYGKAGDRSDQIIKRLKKNKQAQKDLKNADVITLTVGGNDLQQTLFTAFLAESEADVTKTVDESIPTYTKNLEKLTDYIESQNSTAPIYLFGNYNPLYVYLANRDDINNDVKRYNAINAGMAASDSQINYVSTFSTLTYGQYKTAKQKKALVKAAVKASSGSLDNKSVQETLNGDDEEKNAYITNEDHYHPNDIGYDKMSALLVKQMQKDKKAWLGG